MTNFQHLHLQLFLKLFGVYGAMDVVELVALIFAFLVVLTVLMVDGFVSRVSVVARL